MPHYLVIQHLERACVAESQPDTSRSPARELIGASLGRFGRAETGVGTRGPFDLARGHAQVAYGQRAAASRGVVCAPSSSRPALGWQPTERPERKSRRLRHGSRREAPRARLRFVGGGGSTRIFPSPVTRWTARRRSTAQGQAASRSASPSLAPPITARQNRACRPRGRAELTRSVSCSYGRRVR